MTHIVSIGTYLPPWQKGRRRVTGPDEDALTMAVAAGRAADPDNSAGHVVLVTRNFPLIEGGNAAVLLAGLSMPANRPVTEVLGGAPAVLDQIARAVPGTLVIAADDSDSAVGAAAVLTDAAPAGASLARVDAQTRSLPVVARSDDGSRNDYNDPRLHREVGVRSTLARLRLNDSVPLAAVAGIKTAMLGPDFDISATIEDASTSASAAIRVIAEAVDLRRTGLILANEQSTITAAELALGDVDVRITRDEPVAQDEPKSIVAEGTGIPISLAAYARAFEPKLRWEAAVFDERPGIDGAPQFPPRLRVDDAGVLAADYRLTPLPRTGIVYTRTTIRIPVPDLASPYSLAVVQLDDSPVRVLLKITGTPAGETGIGEPGSVVLRKIATRTGVPDYGYAFWPDRTHQGAQV